MAGIRGREGGYRDEHPREKAMRSIFGKIWPSVWETHWKESSKYVQLSSTSLLASSGYNSIISSVYYVKHVTLISNTARDREGVEVL